MAPAITTGDPHITFAHGGRADFRGQNRRHFAFVSTPGFQFAPFFQEVDFWYKTVTGLSQLVHGTFMTQAAWRLRTARACVSSRAWTRCTLPATARSATGAGLPIVWPASTAT